MSSCCLIDLAIARYALETWSHHNINSSMVYTIGTIIVLDPRQWQCWHCVFSNWILVPKSMQSYQLGIAIDVNFTTLFSPTFNNPKPEGKCTSHGSPAIVTNFLSSNHSVSRLVWIRVLVPSTYSVTNLNQPQHKSLGLAGSGSETTYSWIQGLTLYIGLTTQTFSQIFYATSLCWCN